VTVPVKGTDIATTPAKSSDVLGQNSTTSAQRFLNRNRPPRVQIRYEFFTPENVAMVVSLVSAAVGASMAAIKGIEAWLTQRTTRKIKIRYKDLEIELSGALSEQEINDRIKVFEQLHGKIEAKNIKIELAQ
jgi:predicted component of type VI protein secretion system